LSIIQGPFSVAPCQTLISRFATFSSPYLSVEIQSPFSSPIERSLSLTGRARGCETHQAARNDDNADEAAARTTRENPVKAGRVGAKRQLLQAAEAAPLNHLMGDLSAALMQPGGLDASLAVAAEAAGASLPGSATGADEPTLAQVSFRRYTPVWVQSQGCGFKRADLLKSRARVDYNPHQDCIVFFAR
jgi:hypothetical protein